MYRFNIQLWEIPPRAGNTWYFSALWVDLLSRKIFTGIFFLHDTSRAAREEALLTFLY